MNTTELKKLAEAAIYSDTVALPFARADFHEAANPAAISKLLAINAELADELKFLIEIAEGAMIESNRDGGEYDVKGML